MPDQFHFLQPAWFLVLIPMLLLLWWLPRAGQNDSNWQRACESHLLPYLLNKPVQALNQFPLWLLATGWLIAIIALADPTWQKQPQPVYRNQDALVIVLDLSQSMLSNDLTPSRLDRAHYKVADILKKRKEGQTGLVVFAGDAFTVSPLTTDSRTILSLLRPLEPNLMPVQGSRVDLGLRKAADLLKQSGQTKGNIVLITDGYSDPTTPEVAADLKREGYRLSILGVGSNKPSPIPDINGEFVRDSYGKVVMSALDSAKLQQLTNLGGGHYHTITVDDSDLDYVLPSHNQTFNSKMDSTEQVTDKWQSQGPLLVLFLLPLAAFAFRRGWLLVLPLTFIISLAGMPQPAMASGWDDLWQRPDQQANKALKSGDFNNARQLARHPLRRGEAAYRAGDYKNALDDFSKIDTAQAHYNRGNTLAQLGQYKEAIAAYDAALAKNADIPDAIHNKKEVEKLLQQQKNKQNDKDKNNQQAGNNSTDKGKDKDKQQQQASNKADGNGKDNQQQQASNKSDGNGKEEQQQASNNAEDKGKEDQQQASNKTDGNGKDDAQQQASNKTAGNGKEDQQQQASNNTTDETKDLKPLAENKKATGKNNVQAQNPVHSEQQLADERWLRRIPDDPGGLLRRKFLYQYSQRGAEKETSQQAW